ncbi:methylisocitrate lyase [Stylonychia lemnae]|uniref:Methylisocitrate lyase n=1 Tax=Stylonychia lemnae TaxID=5949 RepID=A0A078BAG2_STYLE|nr:methylisocitrate lyase [Stylonychia lemnae]|eukprot:CDW90533.1 methylisocitrate lyase [Stylonychia lemnae]
MPGAFNGLTARMMADLNFQATYISGAALSASRGVPDIGILGLENFTQLIEDVYVSSNLPIIADADTGFGEGEMCSRTVFAYNKAGAAGLHIEDQEFPKRCGHLDGKTLITIEDMKLKVKICADVRDKHSNGDFIVYAGADMIFPEGLQNTHEFEEVAQKLRNHKKDVYLLANMTEFGKTESIIFQQFSDMKYSCVIYPVSTLRIAMGAVQRFLVDLQKNGHATKSSLDSMLSRKDLYELLNYKPGEQYEYPSPKESKDNNISK